MPIAALVFLLCVVALELAAGAKRQWFADMAAWQWESKRDFLNAGVLDGDIAVFGTSVLFHGLDPEVSNLRSPGSGRVVNLALNGMALQHETQLLRERLASKRPPAVVVLEFRRITVERDTWIAGPYFRFWASFRDLLESRFYYWDAPLALTFWADRIFVTFRYRDALNNWVFDIARERGLPRHTRDRNRATAASIQEHAGMAPATFDDDVLKVPSGPQPERVWAVDSAGELWLRKFLTTAEGHGVRLVLLLPPSPPYFAEKQGPEGFRARFEAEVEQLRQRHPSLGIEVFEPKGFALANFADEVHVNATGRTKLSAEFADWIAEYRARHGLR